jgi:hypothetical protein
MLQYPTWVESELQSGHQVPVYAYAANNPIGATDPTGLFVLRGRCANWSAAVAEAKRLAGCNRGKMKSPTECLYQVTTQAGCSICGFLEDGMGPDAYVKNLGSFGGHTNVGAPGSMYNTSTTGLGAVAAAFFANAHPEPSSVAVSGDLCTGAGNIKALATVLIEEASHYCASKTGKPFPDPQAGELAGKCNSWNACPIKP